MSQLCLGRVNTFTGKVVLKQELPGIEVTTFVVLNNLRNI